MEAVLSRPPASRARTLAHALRLEYLTVGWNVIEGVVAIAAALAAGEGLRGESCCDGEGLIEHITEKKDACCDAGHCH